MSNRTAPYHQTVQGVVLSCSPRLLLILHPEHSSPKPLTVTGDGAAIVAPPEGWPGWAGMQHFKI